MNFRNRATLAGLFLLLGITLLLAGCQGGPERVAVTGTVTLDAKPLPTGTITFIPTGTGPASQATITNGQFKIPQESGPAVGTYKVEILSSQPTGRMVPGIGADGSGKTAEMKQVIPTRYNSQSKLQQVLQSGENTCTFELTSR